MLAGHYAASFAGKGVEPRLPLWSLFLAAQLVDLIHFVLLLLGIERTSLDFSLPSNPLVIEYVPYTHSLLASALWALASAGVVRRIMGAWRPACVFGVVVLSHWFLDMPMHRGDLSLFGEAPTIGFALWNTPWLADVVEFGTLALGVIVYFALAQPPPELRRVALILAAVLAGVQVYSIAVPPPPTVPLIAVSLLVTQAALIGLAAWLARRAASSAAD